MLKLREVRGVSAKIPGKLEDHAEYNLAGCAYLKTDATAEKTMAGDES